MSSSFQSVVQDLNLSEVDLEVFIKRWESGETTCEPSWSVETKHYYKIFVQRQRRQEKIRKDKDNLRNEYLDYFESFLTCKDCLKYPPEWLDDFQYTLYQTRVLNVKKAAPKKLWKQEFYNSYDKYHLYTRFVQNFDYRNGVHTKREEYKKGNTRPLILHLIKQEEARQKQKRNQTPEQRELALEKDRNRKRQEKLSNPTRLTKTKPVHLKLFYDYFQEAIALKKEGEIDEIHFLHRKQWITAIRQNKFISSDLDKIPFPEFWSDSMKQDYRNWKARRGRAEGIVKDYKETLAYAWAKVRRSAKLRGLPLSITKEQVAYLVKCPCHYCHRDACKVFRIGIDCVISKLGYIEGNVVPCCYQCNVAKLDADATVFKARCLHITKFFSKEDSLSPNEELFKRSKSLPSNQFHIYKRRAKCSKIRFYLQEDEFTRMIKGCCHYCGLPECNGVDRINNFLSYDILNTTGCCKTCNLMKFVYSKEAFIEMCKLVASCN